MGAVRPLCPLPDPQAGASGEDDKPVAGCEDAVGWRCPDEGVVAVRAEGEYPGLLRVEMFTDEAAG